MPSKKLAKKRVKTTLNDLNANPLALVTGASSGIGEVLAKYFAERDGCSNPHHFGLTLDAKMAGS
jgi:hypothetical protein